MLLALSALLLALGITASVPSKAYADEVKYYGLVTYIPVYDEKGYPEYDSDGTPIQNASVMLYGISGASGVVKLPESFDLTVLDEDGTGTEVVSNVKPSILSIQRCYHSEELEEEWGHASWSNGNVTGIDLTLCKDLRALYFSRDTSCEGGALSSLNIKGLTKLGTLAVYDSTSGTSGFGFEADECESLVNLQCGGKGLDPETVLKAAGSKLDYLEIVGSSKSFALEGKWTQNLTTLFLQDVSAPLASYDINDPVMSVLDSVHPGSSTFAYGYPRVSIGEEYSTVFSAKSSDESVAKVVFHEEYNELSIECLKAGSAEITITDLWDNEVVCPVAVVDVAAEAKKLSLNETELTIKKGEVFDLSQLVEGLDDLNKTCDEDQTLVFKSSNGYYAPITFTAIDLVNDSARGHFASVLGRNVGDVIITAGVRYGEDLGDSALYADEWQVAEFGTLTLHVVDDEAVAVSGVTLGASELELFVGAEPSQLTATVQPATASNQRLRGLPPPLRWRALTTLAK